MLIENKLPKLQNIIVFNDSVKFEVVQPWLSR